MKKCYKNLNHLPQTPQLISEASFELGLFNSRICPLNHYLILVSRGSLLPMRIKMSQ